MVFSIASDHCVVEEYAGAAFPFGPACHAEFRAAAAGHMIASVRELDGGFAVVAALPALFFGCA